MPTLPRDKLTLHRGLQTQYGGIGTNLLVETFPAGLLSWVQHRPDWGVTGNPLAFLELGGLGRSNPPPLWMNPGRIGYPSLRQNETSHAQWESDWRGPKYGAPSGSILFAATCGTHRWSWRRGTAHSRSAPNVIYLLPVWNWTVSISPRRCAPMGKSINSIRRGRMMHRKARQYSRPTWYFCWQWRHLNTFGGSLPHMMMNGQW